MVESSRPGGAKEIGDTPQPNTGSRAPTAAAALRSTKARARRAEFNYLNDRGGRVFFEFVGVLDLLKLGIECDPDEMWYDFCSLLKPMERKSKLLPAEFKLNAIAAERGKRAATPAERTRTHQKRTPQAHDRNSAKFELPRIRPPPAAPPLRQQTCFT